MSDNRYVRWGGSDDDFYERMMDAMADYEDDMTDYESEEYEEEEE